MDVQQVAKQLREQLEALATSNPLLVPVVGSIAGLLFVIALLYSCGASSTKKKLTGTVFEGGVRRSTRAHKQPEKLNVDSPAPAKTPRAVKTPRTAKTLEEATTVTPKAATWPRRAAAAKTPATVEPATTRRSTRATAKTPAK